MRLAEGEALNSESAIEGVEIWGRAHYMVLPPSIHPQGTVYQWITPDPYHSLPMGEPPPVVSVDALDWVGVRLAKRRGSKWEEPELFGLPGWAAGLSLANRQTLAEGAEDGQRNKKLSDAAYDMKGNDIPLEEAEGVLIAAAGRCSPPYPHPEAQAIIKSAYRKPRQPARKTKARESLPWQRAAAFAQAYDWRRLGRKAQTARAVFLACVERARLDGGQVFRASERETAELSNVTRKTARRGLALLVTAGLIRWAAASESGAHLYAFQDVEAETQLITPIIPLAVCSGVNNDAKKHKLSNPVTQAEQDVFSKLGKVGFRVWEHLKVSPEPTAAAVARAAGLVEGSARSALNKLLKHGLVSRSQAEGLYIGESKTQAELERLAAALGTYGRSEKRKREHERERGRRLNLLLMKERERWFQTYLRFRDKQNLDMEDKEGW